MGLWNSISDALGIGGGGGSSSGGFSYGRASNSPGNRAPTTSPRPQKRPGSGTSPPTRGPASWQGGDGNDRGMVSRSGSGGATAATPPPRARRGPQEPDAGVIAQAARRRQGTGSSRGVLASVYRLPEDSAVAARTLQQFNGNRRGGLMLGR